MPHLSTRPNPGDATAIAFSGSTRLALGPVHEVALAVYAARDTAGAPVLVLDARTSTPIDFDLRGSATEIAERYAPVVSTTADDDDAEPVEAPRGPGRPRLGVVPREVTLLPRHWDWLATQPGGASASLRRLVEAARSASVDADRARDAADSTYRFLMHLAGNEPGFEEATRALFAGERERFHDRIGQWPEDVRAHAEQLAEPVFERRA